MCVHVLIVNVHHLAFITHCSTYTLQVYMHPLYIYIIFTIQANRHSI